MGTRKEGKCAPFCIARADRVVANLLRHVPQTTVIVYKIVFTRGWRWTMNSYHNELGVTSLFRWTMNRQNDERGGTRPWR